MRAVHSAFLLRHYRIGGTHRKSRGKCSHRTRHLYKVAGAVAHHFPAAIHIECQRTNRRTRNDGTQIPYRHRIDAAQVIRLCIPVTRLCFSHFPTLKLHVFDDQTIFHLPAALSFAAIVAYSRRCAFLCCKCVCVCVRWTLCNSCDAAIHCFVTWTNRTEHCSIIVDLGIYRQHDREQWTDYRQRHRERTNSNSFPFDTHVNKGKTEKKNNFVSVLSLGRWRRRWRYHIWLNTPTFSLLWILIANGRAYAFFSK